MKLLIPGKTQEKTGQYAAAEFKPSVEMSKIRQCKLHSSLITALPGSGGKMRFPGNEVDSLVSVHVRSRECQPDYCIESIMRHSITGRRGPALSFVTTVT